MTGLNITNVRDYSMFMAISSHKQVCWNTQWCDGTFQCMQGVGQSVAWSQYLKYSGGKLLSQLCLEEPTPTRSEHLAVPPLLEDGEDGGGKIEDAKDEDKKRTTGRAEQGRHGKETKSWKAKQLFIGRCRKWELFECSLLIFLFFLWSLQETLCHLSKLMSFSQPPSLISDF